jgi:hypothetical protein
MLHCLAEVPELGDIVIARRFWHKDFMHYLSSQFGNPDFDGHFVMDFQPRTNSLGKIPTPSGLRYAHFPHSVLLVTRPGNLMELVYE